MSAAGAKSCSAEGTGVSGRFVARPALGATTVGAPVRERKTVSATGATNIDPLTGVVCAQHQTHVADPYERHHPEQTVLYKALQEHWLTFLCELESAAELPVLPVLPAFVISEVTSSHEERRDR